MNQHFVVEKKQDDELKKKKKKKKKNYINYLEIVDKKNF